MKIKSSSILVYAMALALAFLFTSCIDQKQGKDRSTGKTNEILIVTDTKAQWNGAIGDTLRALFEQEMPGMPQSEPLFRALNVEEASFNKTFKKLHSIFIVHIDPNFDEPLVEMKRDLWTSPQQVIKVTARDKEWFFAIFNQYKDIFLKKFKDLEIERTNKYFHMASSVKLKQLLIKKFGFSMDLPGGFSIARQTENFIWLRQTIKKVKQDVEMGIMIYKRPYTDTLVFQEDIILNTRDSLTKAYIAGPSEGSYMAVSKEVIQPEIRRTRNFKTGYVVETRGLWKVINDFMGGPFISYTFVDPQNENVITLDGYVYNPSGMKRNFVRQLEALFHTIEFVKKEKNESN
jgi:hypothetical protein